MRFQHPGLLSAAALIGVACSCGGTVSSTERLGADASAGGQAGASGGGTGGVAASGSGGGQTGAGGEAGQASGGGGLGGSGGAAGTGGFSGAPECLIPVLDQGPARIDEGPIVDNRLLQDPILLGSESTPSLVTLVYQWTSWPGGTVTGLRFLRFAAWEPWSDGPLAPAVQPLPENMVEPGLRAASGPNGSIGVLFQYVEPDPDYHAVLAFAEFPEPSQDWPAILPVTQLPSWQHWNPLFVVRGKSDYAVAWNQGTEATATHTLVAGTVSTDGGFVPEAPEVDTGCASLPEVADAMALNDGYLLASSVDKICCGCGGQEVGPPRNVMVRRMGSDPEQATMFTGTEPVVYVRLAPRDEGAWLVIGRATGDESVKLEIARVDKQGKVLALPTAWPEDFLFAHPVAAQLGNHLALGWVSQGRVHAATLTSEGVLAQGSFESPFATDAGPGQVSLLADSSGSRLLLAWSHPDPEQPERRIHVARFAFGCEK